MKSGGGEAVSGQEWTPVPTDARLADLAGHTVVVSAGGEAAGIFVIEIVAADGDGRVEDAGADNDRVEARIGRLGTKTHPTVVTLPGGRRLGDFVIEHTEMVIDRAMTCPPAVWPEARRDRNTFNWGVFAAFIALSLLLGHYLGAAGYLFPWMVGLVTASAVAGRRIRALHIPGGGLSGATPSAQIAGRLAEVPTNPVPRSLVVGRVAAPGTREMAVERVAAVKARYGALLVDVAYRIENSALFDPAVEQTREFTLALTLWDGRAGRLTDHEAVTLSRDIQLAFDTARAHAETLGMSHLPARARSEAGRAVKAARLAQSTTSDSERAAAIAQVNCTLASLALYYLPDEAETTAALGGGRPAVER